jgi:hypothetical protein
LSDNIDHHLISTGDKMKKLTFGVLLVFTVLVAATGQTKKYDIKSGIVTFETTMKVGTMSIVTKSIVYFDDFGTKECKETYKDDVLKESFFSDGETLYALYHASKTAMKRGVAYRGTEFRFNWNEISDKDKKSGKAKQLPGVTIAGKKCESFEYSDGGTTTKYAGWSNICLMIDLTSKTVSSMTKAVKLEENAKVSADKFAVPAGFTLK